MAGECTNSKDTIIASLQIKLELAERRADELATTFEEMQPGLNELFSKFGLVPYAVSDGVPAALKKINAAVEELRG